MQNLAQYLGLGIAMAFVVEGLLYALSPSSMRGMMEKLAQLPPEHIRMGGLLSAAIGVAMAYLLHS